MSILKADNIKEKPMGKLVFIIKILFFVMLTMSLAGMALYGCIDHAQSLEYIDPVFIEDWTVTCPDGNVIKSGSTYRSDGMVNGTYTMVSNLPEHITDDSYLVFIIGGDVSVYIGGELRKDFYAERDIPLPGGCVKRFYMRVPLLPSDSGAEVSIVRYGTSRAGYIYQETMVVDEAGFFGYMMSRYGLSLMLEVILLIFSLVIVIVSLIMMVIYRRRIEMLYGAMSILVISVWLITNSFLFPFMFGHYHIDGIINYIFCLLMPFSLVFYLDSLQHGRYRNIMRGVLLVAALNLILWPVLHFTCVFTFPKALVFINVIMVIELLTVMGVMIFDMIRGGLKEYKYTAVGIAGFMVCGLAEILVLNFRFINNEDVFMLTGLAIMLTLAVVQQISDLRRVREEGQRAVDLSEAKTRFLASMSHEIRTPINAILGMNEMILRENKDPVISDYADSVKSSGQMLLMLVNDVLDFSKIEAGKMEINEAEFSFSSLLRNIMPMLKERADGKNLKLQTVILNDVPDGQNSDEFRIRQIVINLINNAIKYTDKGTVALMLGGEYTGDDSYRLCIRVKDTGRGISEEDQKHLFEAFTRADEKKNRSIEGTGLGLAIVKSIVDSMHGDIGVESTYGVGSEFTVHLPVKVTDKMPLDEDYDKRPGAAAVQSGASDYTAPEAAILTVDDNSSNLRIVKLFLKRLNITPELCDSGTGAIELCRTRKYDLILMDHMMPDPDGIKTLGIIKSDEASLNKETPVVVLTANALAGSGKTYKEAGFVDYLTKPIDSSVLEQTIKKYLPKEKIMSVEEKKTEAAAADEISETGSAGEVTETADDMGETVISDGTDGILNFEPVSFREKLEMIDGLDYETAMSYTGDDEELLRSMIGIITSECEEKIAGMRECVSQGDWKKYCLEAHSIKGLMASIGLQSLSERAKKHEFAAKASDEEFIRSDCEAFFKAYSDVCDKMR